MIKGERGADGERREPRRPHAGPPRTQIDAVSKAIIEQLQQDGRRSYASIGESSGISEDAVRKRVTQLIEAGVMQIVAVTDPLQLGFARQAMIGVIVEGAAASRWPRRSRPSRRSIYVVHHRRVASTSSPRSSAQSDAHLLELVTSRIRPIPGVVAIHTFLYLELQKQTYTWGVHDAADQRSASGLLDLDLVVGVPLADDLLVELADAGARHLVDEGPRVGELPLGEVAR